MRALTRVKGLSPAQRLKARESQRLERLRDQTLLEHFEELEHSGPSALCMGSSSSHPREHIHYRAQALFVFVVHTMNTMSGAMQLSRG